MESPDEKLRMNISLLEDINPISVLVKDLKVFSSKKKESDIISNINFSIKSGQVIGIMGASGSGKTTLLNALCGRLPKDLISGEISFNGLNSDGFHKDRVTAYVQQNDYLMPYLTVREYLQYTAELRLGSLTKREQYRTVQDIIMELGLKDCADTIIGDDWRKGISGGERRRVSVAIQLLVNPSLIFLDEPTTGLDSFTANNLIQTLVDLAKRGRTIFISIHQPRSDIYQLFDSIILLSKGRLVYAGKCGIPMIEYFGKHGHDVPLNVNPADFFIDIVSIDTRDELSEKETNKIVDRLIEEWVKVESAGIGSEMVKIENQNISSNKLGKVEPEDDEQENELLISKKAVNVNGFQQTWILLRRALTNLKRDNLAVWGNLFEVIFIASVMGAIFYNLDESLPGVLSRRSALYIVASMQTYLMLIFIIYKLSLDMKVFDREKADNMYGTIPYMMAQFLSTLPFNILFPLIYSSIMYFMLGLRTDELGLHFFRFFIANLAVQFIVVTFSYFCISIFRDFALASLLGNGLYTFFSFSTGFFQQLDSAPVYVRWIQKISFLTYQYRILAANEFSNNTYSCISTSPQCNGNIILEQLGIKIDDFYEPLFALCIIFLVFWVVAAVFLLIRPNSVVAHAKDVSSSSASSLKAHNRLQSVAKTTKAARINVELKNLTVELIRKKLYPGKKEDRKILLDNICARFPSKSLSIIIGGSGTGKSTLLSILAARSLNYGAMVRLKKSGEMLFDGMKKERLSEITKICAFVRQDDASLLPALTARETLYYQARLRLPKSWTEEEKKVRAEEILGMLGLRHCADTVVGNEALKGLSGGEKRRLSIGVQILTDPSILVIDEPTSGLDSFTAHHIMISLKNMAEAGRTIICSIHQPRSDIFPIFDNLMILTNGGRVAYSGPRVDIFSFFSSLGYILPNHTNPSDYLLDICSIDLRTAEAESESRKRVEAIIYRWNEFIKEERPVSLVSASESSIPDSNEEIQRNQAPFTIAFPVLFSRSILNTRRQPILVFSRIMQVVSLGVIQALFYARQGNGQVSVQNKIGVIQQTLAIFFVGLLNCVAVFPAEKNILFRERADGIYSVDSYFLAYCLIEIPIAIISSLIYTLFAVVLVGLNLSPETYFSDTYAVFLLVATGESIGIAFCSLIDHIGFSISITNSLLGIFVVMSGLMSSKMPLFLDRLNYISPIPYLTRLITVNEFNSNTIIECTAEEVASQLCFYTNGSQVLSVLTSNENFPFDENQKGFYAGIAVFLFLFYRIMAFLVLKYSAH